MHKIEFLRLNKNVWIVVFIRFSDAEITTVLNSLAAADLEDVDFSVKTKFVASSLQAPGYTVVQLDRPNAILPPEIKQIMLTAANEFLDDQNGIPTPPQSSGEQEE